MFAERHFVQNNVGFILFFVAIQEAQAEENKFEEDKMKFEVYTTVQKTFIISRKNTSIEKK